MFSFDENALENEEPEKSGNNCGKYFSKLMKLLVAAYLFVVVAVESFRKIGDEKM